VSTQKRDSFVEFKAGENFNRLFKSDLMDSGSFDAPMRDCELVMHTASPFLLSSPRDPEVELIRPAVEGTRNVLESAKRNPAVKRVVLTSSVVAIYGDNADIESIKGGRFTEKEWNQRSSAAHQGISYIPFEQTIRDHFQQILDDALLK
jgi:nucleoside-diphosphate-sugar epimerase